MKIQHLTRMKKQQGMSLIELMFAGFVLTVGMMGSLIMITTAIASNSRNKFDSTGTMVAQMIIEHINTMPTNQLDSAGALVTQIPIADCDRPGNSPATTWQVGVTGGTAPAGNGATTFVNAAGFREIDWTQDYGAVPATYKMKYWSCGDVVWEARWNVVQISNLTKLITVSARQVGTATSAPRSGFIFAPPVTLRTVSGP